MSVPLSIEVITPELARQYLDGQENVRMIDKSKVSNYASQMRDQKWLLTGEAIIWDEDGKLRNGFHRLTAVATYDVSFTTYVIRGVPRDAWVMMDTGKNRVIGDVFHGRSRNKQVPTVAKYILALDKGIAHSQSNTNYQITQPMIIEFAESNYDDLQKALGVADKLYEALRGSLTAWAVFVYKTTKLYPSVSEQFIESLISGADLSKGDPRLAIRNWFLNNRPRARTRGTGSVSVANALHVLTRGWNAWVEGEEREKMTLPTKKGTIISSFLPPKKEQVVYAIPANAIFPID